MFDSLNYEIIDAHIHPALQIDGSDFSAFNFKTTPEILVNTLKRAGITQAAGSVICRFNDSKPSWEDIHKLNLAALEMHRRFPDFYIPGIHVYPDHIQQSLAEVETMHNEHGVKLIGELVAYLMGYSAYNTPELNDIWALARDLKMVVNLHLNNLEEAADILRNFPDLKLIIAHPTASAAQYTERLELICRYPNAALDISGSGPNIWNMVKHGIKTAGRDKIIFGTDFPLRNPGMYVAGVCFEDISTEDRQAIFAGNFKRLLNS